jgi:hypothetical protein
LTERKQMTVSDDWLERSIMPGCRLQITHMIISALRARAESGVMVYPDKVCLADMAR